MTTLLQPKPKTGAGKNQQTGFTLIELLTTVAILGVLAAIAVPAYNSSVLTAHRSDAKTALLDLATREEKYYSVNNVYSQTPSDLYGSGVTAFPDPQSGATAYYSLSVSTSSAGAAYTATATLKTAGDPCGNFTITNTGTTSVSGTGSCW